VQTRHTTNKRRRLGTIRPDLHWWGIAIGIAGFATYLGLRLLTLEPDSLVASTAAASAATRPSAADLLAHAAPRKLRILSQAALVVDDEDGTILYDKGSHLQRPIASLTKLMTAMVVLDGGQPLDQLIVITNADRDHWRGSRSRLPVGSIWSRGELLELALAASENRAALALARNYPGGSEAFVQAMNAKAAALGMTRTRFADAAGLLKDNVSTARDLIRLAGAAEYYRSIRDITTAAAHRATNYRNRREFDFFNTNRLVRHTGWDVSLSKTGYTSDAGNCLLMRATIGDRPVVIVLLNSWGAFSKYGDAARIRDWLLAAERRLSASVRTGDSPQT
jgi:D-alanyl-D-alanine endopeptidase (penicillin-binding protein 7)